VAERLLAVRVAAVQPGRRVAGSDFSVFMGLLFGGVTYWLLARKSVRADGEATPAVQAAPSAAA